ncbi:MAG: anti-sigma factor antagonist [Oscillospiraceae bacterium]|jgi:stage II sporulation protein AA (anti-sigma F factor antagonist)
MKVYSQQNDGVLRLSFLGELDHHDARMSMKTIETLINDSLPRDCIIDLSGLSFMDSSGIAVILRISKQMTDMGGRAWVENPTGQPLRVLDASGVNRIVSVFSRAD